MFYRKHAFVGFSQGASLASIVDNDIRPELEGKSAPKELRN